MTAPHEHHRSTSCELAAEDREHDDRRIAITGMACRLPGAGTPEALWQNLCHGRESIARFSEDELLAEGVSRELLTRPGYVPAAPVLDAIDLFDAPLFGLTPREAALLDPQQRIFLECAYEALECACCVPASFDGDVGVYAGANVSTYLLNCLAGRGPLPIGAEAFELLLHNAKDYLVTRTAYKLGLTGPAITVQSACSTSLVAVHLACQSLLDRECDVAIAGGASVRVPHRVGYLFEDGLIFSPDGHCRPFDAGANGTVFGSGVAVVVLKRLADALADRDPIEAVILGSAVNNDGAAKVGYTAPSVAGQTEVISTALGVAGVDPASIGAVEAHGTGTQLGDPIELTALDRALQSNTARHAPCLVSSIKSNMGHLDTAAGIAGLLKAVLQLRHGQLAPNLHFSACNPHAGFDPSRISINDRLRDWQADGPLRIGVSSFGIGGTNAHVIVEQAPAPAQAPSEDRPQLLLLSGRTADALDRGGAELAACLVGDSAPVLADAAFTLQTARSHLGHRRVVLAANAAHAAEALLADDGGRRVSIDPLGLPPKLVFLFPGQGAQHPGMGRGLYERASVFRREIDRSAAVLEGLLGFDLRKALCCDGKSDPDEDAAGQLTQTEVAQPALFAIEYALAKQLESWGLQPEAMLGHSVGELVAACLAGVIDRDDALTVIAARGRLMQQRPAGAMLSVALSSTQLEPLLGDAVSVAASNAPMLSVASGPEAEIEALARRLDDEGVPSRRLHTSHAFHSTMMDPVVEPFREQLEKISLHEPHVPFISNITGSWITASEAASPEYWASQLRSPVRFGEGLANVVADRTTALLEVGPGHALCTIARQCFGRDSPHVTVQAMRRPESDEHDFDTLLDAVGRLWAAGVEVDWARLHDNARRRVRLPPRPLERKRYWMSPKLEAVGSATSLELTLPDPSVADGSDRDAPKRLAVPRAGLEQEIARLWESFLGVAPIARDDNFFELGGDSLTAVRTLGLLRVRTGRPVRLHHMIEHPTVADLAAALELEDVVEEPVGDDFQSGIVPDPAHRHDPFPLTELQQAQWIGRASGLEMGEVAAHVYLETESPAIDVERLLDAWRRLVEHHDMLRAVVLPDGRQQVLPSLPAYQIEVRDLTRDDPEWASDRTAEVRTRMSTAVHDAGSWPLWELAVTILPSRSVRVHLSFDLLVADVSSLFFGVLPNWRELYEDPDRRLKPLELSFRDYVLAEARQRSTTEYRRSLEYWQQRARELPPAPELPKVRPIEQLKRPEFTRLHQFIDAHTWESLKSCASSRSITPSVAVLAAYAGTVATFSRSQHFTLNLTAVNRRPVHPDVDRLVGEFASFNLLEVDVVKPDSFIELARQLQERTWTDLEHRSVSGVRVLRELAHIRRSGQAAVMPVVFTSMIGYQAGESLRSAWLGELVYAISQTPQVTLDTLVMEADGGLDISCHAVADLFPEGFLEDFFRAFVSLVESLTAEDAWADPPAARAPAHQLAQRTAINDTGAVVPQGLLHEAVLRQAVARPDAPAVITEDRTMTFAELVGRSLELAALLRSRGLGGSRIGIDLEKGWQQVVGTLAALSAGAAYVPIDPGHPLERRELIATRAEVACVLVERARREAVSWPLSDVLAVPEQESAFEAIDPRAWATPAQPGDIAYVIYTSGSTGTPKGVAVSHRAALNTCVDLCERFSVGPGDRILGLSALSFDLSVFDMLGVLGAGGTLVLPRPEARRDPDSWVRLVHEHGVTIWNSVPALAQMLVDRLGEKSPELPLRLALLSGDWIPVSLPDQLRRIGPAVKVVSLGGATEAAIWSVVYPVDRVSPSWESIPYGTPLRNQRLEVLNERLEPCPTMVVGELYIGGAGLAEGYWGDPQRTAESFLRHPLTGERLYRTGDLARYLPEGNVEFLGRDDFQVKIGGNRVELGEIEHALCAHSDVNHAVVVARGDHHHRQLVAYLTPNRAREDDRAFADEVLALASRLLPTHMVPRAVVVLAALPLTANGKVDRDALPPPGRASVSDEALEVELAEIAGKIARIVAKTLDVESVGIHENFFELGGDSIMGVRVIAEVAADGVEVTPQDLFEHQTIAALVRALSDQGRIGQKPALEESIPLTAGQIQVLREIRHGGASATLVRLPVGDGFDSACMESALTALVARHDALRLRLLSEGDGGRQSPARDAQEECYMPEIDLSALAETDRSSVCQRMIAEMVEELDPTRGPIAKAAVFHLGEGVGELVWLAHRLAIDRASWSLLVRELLALYASASSGAPLVLPMRAGSFQVWASENAAPGCESGRVEQQLPPLPRAWRQELIVTLPGPDTRILREGLEAAYRLTLREGLLATLTWLLCEQSNTGRPIIAIECDRRDGMSLVGCCTEVSLLRPEVDEVHVGAVLAAVKVALRDVRSSPLAELTEDASTSIPAYLRAADCCDWRVHDNVQVAFGADFAGPLDVAAGGAVGAGKMEIACAVVDDELRVRCLHGGDAAAVAVASSLQARLRAIADHCCAADAGELDSSDFPLAGLDQGELASFLAGLEPDVESRCA
jgi:amino acid adenylation domain-containing protein